MVRKPDFFPGQREAMTKRLKVDHEPFFIVLTSLARDPSGRLDRQRRETKEAISLLPSLSLLRLM